MVAFQQWLDDCYNLLGCNSTSDFRECFEVFGLTEQDIYGNMDTLTIYYDRGFEPTEALRKLETELCS